MAASAFDVRALGAGTPALMHAAACGLEAAAGRRAACPGARCPLWEAHPNATAAGCAIEPIVPHLKSRPELVQYLLELREQLGAALL